MKKGLVIIFALIFIVGALTACTDNKNTEPSEPTQTVSENTQGEEAGSEEETDAQSLRYAFEFTDVDGNIHKLSDYEGKPVYLEVWASWCSVCISSLDELDALAAKSEDFVVLSVVTPSVSGEKNKEAFIEWYKKLGYKNLVVMLDEQAQIVNDFGITAYPTQIMFDADGNYKIGFPGLIDEAMIVDIMQSIADGTYE